MTAYKVGYFIGSLATASINRRIAQALVVLAPQELEMEEISFRDLPLYRYEDDTNFPPPAKAFKEAIEAVDAVLFVTPEYNRSIPGGLKNAIDWASRPDGTNSFTRKPSAVIRTSPGAIGTAVAQQSLPSVLSFCKSPQMNAPKTVSISSLNSSTMRVRVTDETRPIFFAATWRNSRHLSPASIRYCQGRG